MAAPLLSTKLHIPSVRHGLVARPHLIKRLNAGLGRKLTCISAPAGFGKTTLVSEWSHCLMEECVTEPCIAWLSLDAGDNDVGRFMAYVVASLQTIEHSLGESIVSVLQSSQGGTNSLSPESILTLIINDLTALPLQAVLVLDDYHVINNLEIHKAVAFLVHNLPPQLHLVVISREDPMLPLPRLRSRGHIAEVRANDLRFSQDEVDLFLEQTMGLDLAPSDKAILGRRTEGWVTGLQLAALSMQNEGDQQGFIEAFAGDDRYVGDYLIAEVLDRQAPNVQEFLLKTSILERLTAPLCDAVTENSSGRTTLTQLEQANLFLIALDNNREWYRYHHLFGDLLHYRLKQQAGQEGVKRLHQRAAAWYRDAGLTDEAIHHSMAAEDFLLATDLIESICGDLMSQSQIQKLLDLVAALPDDLVRSRPRLSMEHAWALGLTAQTAAMESRIKDVERALPNVATTQAREIQGQIASLRANEAYRKHGHAAAIKLLHQALLHLPVTSLRQRCVVNGNLGSFYLGLGKLAEARQTLQLARKEAQASEHLWIDVGVTSALADIHVIDGQLRQAIQLYKEAIDRGLGETGQRLFPPNGYAYAGLGKVLYELGEMDEADRCLRQAIRLGEMTGLWRIAQRAIGPRAWLEHLRGDSGLAQTLLQWGLDLAEQTRHSWENGGWKALLSAYQVRIWLALEPPRLDAAARWAKAYQEGAPDRTSFAEFVQLTLARVELAQGQPDRALARLRQLKTAALAGGRYDDLIKILALEALVEAAQGLADRAVDTLDRALELAASEGYCRSFLDAGQAMIQLLQRSRHPYAAHLRGVKVADERVVRITAMARTLSAPHLEGAVNAREIQALRLFAAGLTNAEVAQEMFISVNTVKWYAKNIYRKLNVTRRAHAVAKARELGLIS